MRHPRLRNSLGVQEEREQPSKTTAFEILMKLVPVVLAFIALVQEQQARFWGLLVFAALSLFLGFYRSTVEGMKHLLARRQDERLARQRFVQLRGVVRHFAEFVDAGRSDNIQEIALSEICRRNTGDFSRLGLTPVQLFNGFWFFLSQRMNTQEPNLANLLGCISEFGHLIGSYSQGCLMPIFERYPQDLRASLTPEAKSSLESFRERFVLFLDSNEHFLKDLADSLNTAQI